MERLVRTDGIVISVRDLGEADRVLHLICPAEGRVQAVARGARRPRSRLAAATQLFVLGTFVLMRGPDLWSVTQAEIKRTFPRISADLARTAAAATMCETVSGLAGEGESGRKLYGLLQAALTVLDARSDPLLVLARFLARAAAVAGFGPELASCAVCGSVPTSPAFAAEAGGIICAHCGRGTPVSAGGLDALRALAGPERMVAVADGNRDEALSLLVSFIESCLERPLKSLSFLRHVRSSEGERPHGGAQ